MKDCRYLGTRGLCWIGKLVRSCIDIQSEESVATGLHSPNLGSTQLARRRGEPSSYLLQTRWAKSKTSESTDASEVVSKYVQSYSDLSHATITLQTPRITQFGASALIEVVLTAISLPNELITPHSLLGSNSSVFRYFTRQYRLRCQGQNRNPCISY